MPRVSVGMPVFNGGATFERALAAVLTQSLVDIEVIVSDNASTDATGDIARRHAACDARIRYVRQGVPLSAYDNFRFVLREARAPYFMWAAADDHARPALLARACAVLDARAEVVGCVPRVEFLDAAGRVEPARGTFSLPGTARENICAFLRRPVDNSRFYGVYRRDALARAVPAEEFYAVDWAISLGTLRDGTHVELPEVLLVRGANPAAKYLHLIDAYYGRRAIRFLPLAPFTGYVLGELRPVLSPCALFHLLRLNLWFHLAYCRSRYPRYGRPAFRVAEAVDHGVAKLLGSPTATRREDGGER